MKKLFPTYVRVPLIFAAVMIGMEYLIDSGNMPAFIKYPMVGVFLLVFLFLLIAIEMVVTAIEKVTVSLMTEEQKKQREIEDAKSLFESKWYKNLMAKLTKAKALESEDEITLHHDYDGIKELDNDLPPWWVYLFYVTILFAVAYLSYYHLFGGDNQYKEFDREWAQAQKEIEAYKLTATDLIDKETVVLLTEAGDLATGKKIFDEKCAACHKTDGGGSIGPNLTDDHWILGGGIKNVFNTIMEGGREGKGMIPWKSELKPSEVQKVSSYILSLRGSNPAEAKAPEGELWVDPEAASPVEESTESVVDSLTTK